MEATLLRNDLKKQKWKKVGNKLFTFVRAIVLAGICYYILYPLIVKLSLAVMAEQDLYDSTVAIIPRNFSLDMLKTVWETMDYPTAAVNSLLITVIATVAQVIACTVVGYGFAKFDFPLKKFWFAMVIFTLIVPPSTIIIPTFLNYRFFDFTGGLLYGLTDGAFSVNLIGSEFTFVISGLTCMGFRNGLYIFLIRQCYRGVPKELEEAAMIDGAGYFKTFYRVMLPSAKSILTTIIMFSVVWQWTDVFYTTWFMRGGNILALKLSSLRNNMATVLGSNFSTDPNRVLQINAIGSLMVLLPLIIMYIFGQKMFVEGVERSGIVG